MPKLLAFLRVNYYMSSFTEGDSDPSEKQKRQHAAVTNLGAQSNRTNRWMSSWYIWLVEWTIRSTQGRWNIKIVWIVFTNIKWKIKLFIMNLKKIYIENKKLFILFLRNVYSSFNTYFYGNVLKFKKIWEMKYFLRNMYLKVLSSHSTNIGKHF